MKNNFTHQEILLMANSHFSAREYSLKNEAENGPGLTPKEKLAEACWNGLITQILPEINLTVDNKPLTIWEVSEGREAFYLKLGEIDIVPEAAFTLNPYRFIARGMLN
ncbi:MAG: hypothetical protein ABIT07_04930 [Ferruginibacter sp.]